MKRVISILLTVLMLTASGCSRISKTEIPSSVTGESSVIFSVPESQESSDVPVKDPDPEPSSEPAPSEPVVSEEISELQELLKKLSFYNGEITGILDEATVSSISAFQKANGIEVTGEYDDATKALIQQGLLIPDEDRLPLKGYVIGLDPGHQRHGNSDLEPVAPGSEVMKKKVSSGTQGKWTRTPEWEVCLTVALRLRDLLEATGATVVMTHDTPDVDISNSERAMIFNENETDYALRLHCDGNADETAHGAFMLIPKSSPWYDDCVIAGELLLEEYCASTGAYSRGLTYRSDQTGFNWCERMIINIEMGYMTNREEDLLLSDPEYQEKMAQGLYKGILRYFREVYSVRESEEKDPASQG